MRFKVRRCPSRGFTATFDPVCGNFADSFYLNLQECVVYNLGWCIKDVFGEVLESDSAILAFNYRVGQLDAVAVGSVGHVLAHFVIFSIN